MHTDVTLIGFGEAASTFSRAARWAGRARSFDILPARARAMADLGVQHDDCVERAVSEADLVLSLVTADQALVAAQAAAPHLPANAIWCDMNSVAPETKRSAADAIQAAGGRYVDVAVLAPVEPARLTVPMLLSGADADETKSRLAALGFTNIRVVGTEIGRASAIKMIRSVMVKGVEALTDEMMAAARAAKVEDEVLASLDASEKAQPWAVRAAYNIERMTTHGARRAAEMEESARTLLALGVQPVMTQGTIKRQRDAAGKTPA